MFRLGEQDFAKTLAQCGSVSGFPSGLHTLLAGSAKYHEPGPAILLRTVLKCYNSNVLQFLPSPIYLVLLEMLTEHS